FPSVDKRHHIRFMVYEPETYSAIEHLLEEEEDLVEYMMYEEARVPLYLPVEPTELRSRTITIDTIDPPLFVDALFLNPSIVVTPNFGESYFIDGQREMRAVENDSRLEFTNPLENTTEQMGREEIIEHSLAN